jgi:transcription antitermination factor NusG
VPVSAAQWFAVRVKPRFEKAVASAAHKKGFEAFLPVCLWHREGSERSKRVRQPLFPGYVFCRLDAAPHRFALLTIPGVLHIVAVGTVPALISDAEITALQNATRSQLRVEPWPLVEAGERIRLRSGSASGIEGFLIQAHKQPRVVINLPTLKMAVAVEIEQSWVESAPVGSDILTTGRST